MTLKQVLLAMRARWSVAVLVLVLSVAAASFLNQRLAGIYTATTSLIVDVRSRDPVAALFMPGSIATQVEIISSERVARRVAKLLRLDEDPALREQWLAATEGAGAFEHWLAGYLLAGMEVQTGRDGSSLLVAYKARDPQFAAAAANAFAQAYIDATIELKVEPAKQYSRWFDEQGKQLRENLEEAQANLSRFQRKKGIVALDESDDTENTRLAALSAQLTAIQEQNAEARSKQRLSGSVLSDVAQSPAIAALRSDIARMEAKLQEASVNLGTNHPQYRRMQSELAEMRANLEAETQIVTSGIQVSGSVGRDREAAIRAAIEAQKRKLLELKSDRDQLAVLQRDVDAAKQAYDAITSRLHQANLEAQATQANVSVLTPAGVPRTPSFPKPLQLVLLASLLLGAAAGVAAAVGLEMLDRRIRSPEDLGEMLQVPVLGVVVSGVRNARLGGRRLPALRAAS